VSEGPAARQCTEQSDHLIGRLCHAHPLPAHSTADLLKRYSLVRSRWQRWASLCGQSDQATTSARSSAGCQGVADSRRRGRVSRRAGWFFCARLDWAARYAAGGTRVLAAEQGPACQQAGLGPLPAGTAGKVIAYAEAQLGKPYLWGATGPDAFDCSGLTMMAYRAAGITIPRTSQQQWAYGPRIPASQARPGDLIFFAGSDGTMTAPGHVGIVTGHDTMIDAPYTGQVVREESFSGSTDLAGFTRP